MRAGLYVHAPVNTNECAQSSTRITDVDVCRAAAPVLGRAFSVSGTFAGAPRGCYSLTTTGAVGLNAHSTGAAAADKQLVCYTGTPAPTDVGDTNPPTRAPTAPPTFAPTGKSDARDMPTSAHYRSTTRARMCVVLWRADRTAGPRGDCEVLLQILVRGRVLGSTRG